MITTLISLLPFTLIIYFIFLQKKRNSISYEILSSKRCYSCKGDITPDVNIEVYPTLSICKSCDRDRNINLLFSKRLSILELKLKRTLLSTKWRKIHGFLILTTLITVISGSIIKIFYGKELYLVNIGNIVNSFIWILMILEFNYLSIKKPK